MNMRIDLYSVRINGLLVNKFHAPHRFIKVLVYENGFHRGKRLTRVAVYHTRVSQVRCALGVCAVVHHGELHSQVALVGRTGVSSRR